MNRDTLNAIFFFVFVVAIGLVSLMVVQPLLSYLIAAIMLVFITYPMYEEVEGRTGHPRLSSMLIVILLIVAVIVPSVIVTMVAFNEAGDVTRTIVSSGFEVVKLQEVEGYVQDLTGRQVDLEQPFEESLRDITRGLTESLAGLLEAVTNFVIGVFVMVFTMYYLYIDGPSIVSSIREMLPLQEERRSLLFKEVEEVTWGVVVGHLLTSVIQGTVGAIGFYLFGISNAAFWGFIMIILALIPMIGPILLYLPAGAILFLGGDTVPGIGLVVYGAVVVSFVDNFVRPFFVERRAHIHPVLTLIGVLGGLGVFGLMGLFIGPLILAVFVATLRTYSRED